MKSVKSSLVASPSAYPFKVVQRVSDHTTAPRQRLDRLLPLAHRYGVEMRCCCDDSLFGHRTPVEAKVRPGSAWVLQVSGLICCGLTAAATVVPF